MCDCFPRYVELDDDGETYNIYFHGKDGNSREHVKVQLNKSELERLASEANVMLLISRELDVVFYEEGMEAA